MRSPKVSIITPCYNGEAFLDGYFKSILAQTYKELELIFVNDGSTDRTAEIALSYREALESRGIIYKYLYQPNKGQASAMNTGFREMSGEYLVWPDSDDILTEDSIAKRVQFLESNPQYGFVRSNGIYFDFETGQELRQFSCDESRFREDIFLDLILDTTFCCCGCYMIRCKLLREIYPNLSIYESEAGQNWQILIPMAGKYLCGYIDELQYKVAVRTNSHSHQVKPVNEVLERYAKLEDLLRRCVAISGRTDRDYERIIYLKHLRTCLHVYLSHGDLKNAQKYYTELRKSGGLEENERRMFLQIRYPVGYQFYLLHCQARHAIGEMLKRMHLRK